MELLNEQEFQRDYTKTINKSVSHYVTEPKGSSISNAKRVIALRFTYNKDNGLVYYGASIFRREKVHEACYKKKIAATAETRFREQPVGIKLNLTNETKVVDIIRQVRSALVRYGCSRRIHEEKIVNNDEIINIPRREVNTLEHETNVAI